MVVTRRVRKLHAVFFCVVVFFHTPWGNVLKLPKWFNSMHAVFFPSTFGLVVLLARQKETWLSDLHTWIQVNDLIQVLIPVERRTLLHRRRGNAAPHKWRRRATYHHPKGERDESTATHKIEGEKHHHSNGGGIKQHHPHKGGKTAPAQRVMEPLLGLYCSLLPSFCVVVFSPLLLLVGGVCLPLSLSLFFPLSLSLLAWCCFFPSPPPSGWWCSFPFPSVRGGVSQHPSLTWCSTCCSIRLCHWVGIDFQNLTWRRRSEAPPPKGGGEERSTSPKGPGTTPRTLGNSDNSQQLTLLSSSSCWVLLSFSSLWRSGAVLLSFGSVLPSFLSTLGYGASPSATENLIMLLAQMESSHHTRRKERENTASQTEAEGKAAPHQGGRRHAAPARRWVALSLPSLCMVVFSVSLFFWVVVLSPRSLWHVAIRAA